MPTYEYRCKSCGHEMAVVQAFSDDPLSTCPECAGALRKVYGNVGISFKGSGFYKNDARGSSKSSSSSSSGSTSTAASTSSESKASESTSSTPEKSSTPAASSATSSSD